MTGILMLRGLLIKKIKELKDANEIPGESSIYLSGKQHAYEEVLELIKAIE